MVLQYFLEFIMKTLSTSVMVGVLVRMGIFYVSLDILKDLLLRTYMAMNFLLIAGIPHTKNIIQSLLTLSMKTERNF